MDVLTGATLRYGLVFFLAFFGCFKFAEVEARAIVPLIENSPFMAWLYGVSSIQAVSSLIGAIEIALAALIVARRWSPVLCFVGSLGAAVTFVLTLSFLASTPALFVAVPGFPLPVANETGGFLAKDVFLLGAAAWSASESGRAIRLNANAAERS